MLHYRKYMIYMVAIGGLHLYCSWVLLVSKQDHLLIKVMCTDYQFSANAHLKMNRLFDVIVTSF